MARPDKTPRFSDFYSFLCQFRLRLGCETLRGHCWTLRTFFVILQLDSNSTRFFFLLLYSFIVISEYGKNWASSNLISPFPRRLPCTSMRVWMYSRGRRSFSSFPYLLKPKCARSTSWWRPSTKSVLQLCFSVLISFLRDYLLLQDAKFCTSFLDIYSGATPAIKVGSNFTYTLFFNRLMKKWFFIYGLTAGIKSYALLLGRCFTFFIYLADTSIAKAIRNAPRYSFLLIRKIGMNELAFICPNKWA